MSTVAFYTGPQEWYRQVIVEHEEIYSSPMVQFPDERNYFRAPGPYSVAKELEAMPPPFNKPDRVLVMLDMDAPADLAGVNAKKVIFVGDTHHGQSPITRRIKAMQGQPWDLVVLEFCPHHLHWFLNAGLPAVFIGNFNVNPFWIPVPAKRAGGIVMIGQCGDLHPRRRYVVEQLQRCGYPILVRQAHPADAAKIYNSASVCLNVALNGDYNNRNVEIVAAGGTIITECVYERPTPAPCVVDEFAREIDDVLGSPDDALRLASENQNLARASHSQEVLASALLEALEHGPLTVSNAPPPSDFWDHLAAYEIKQETRRTSLE